MSISLSSELHVGKLNVRLFVSEFTALSLIQKLLVHCYCNLFLASHAGTRQRQSQHWCPLFVETVKN